MFAGSIVDRGISGQSNFDTEIESPNALRFVSRSFASDESSEVSGKKGSKRRKKNRTGQQACCVAGADGGKNCTVM